MSLLTWTPFLVSFCCSPFEILHASLVFFSNNQGKKANVDLYSPIVFMRQFNILHRTICGLLSQKCQDYFGIEILSLVLSPYLKPKSVFFCGKVIFFDLCRKNHLCISSEPLLCWMVQNTGQMSSQTLSIQLGWLVWHDTYNQKFHLGTKPIFNSRFWLRTMPRRDFDKPSRLETPKRSNFRFSKFLSKFTPMERF